MDSKEQFVHLHVHSDHSQLDGCAKIGDYVQAISERGGSAFALTDHGTMRGLFDLTEACNEYNIKPIYGVEFYICEDMYRKGLTDEDKKEIIGNEKDKTIQKRMIQTRREELGLRKRWHLTAWALDNEGLKNLYKLSSLSWNEGYYYKPRIDFDTLEKYNKGIAVGTGCVASMLNSFHIENNYRKTQDLFSRMFMTFADRLYLEVMPHPFDEQILANTLAIEHSKITEGYCKLLATQDAHYLNAENKDSHNVLLAIGTDGKLDDKNRFQFVGDYYWLKTQEEMRSSLEYDHNYFGDDRIKESIYTTKELADRCTAKIEIDPLKCLLPFVEIPGEYNGDEVKYFGDLLLEGWQKRDINSRAKRYADKLGISYNKALFIYNKRMRREFKVLRKSGFIKYFLVIKDLYHFADQNNIVYGPGRGSAAGSLVAYLIGITHVDPIQHGLMFERFISPGRINMPDIDCDFADSRRNEIIDYLCQKHGQDKVAQISTFTSMAGRQSIKDVARVRGVPYSEAMIASATINQDTGNDIDTALKHSDVLQDFKKKYPEVVNNAIELEGMIKSIGVHAAGLVVSPVPLDNIVPLEVRRPAGKEVNVTAFDMRGVEGIGLLKIDILGLRTISIFADAKEAILKRYDNDFDYDEVPLDDQETLLGFTNRDFIGVFQFDSRSAHSVCDGLVFTEFNDIAAVNAINRPGALAFADEFKKRKANPKKAKKDIFHPKVTEITSDSLGLMIYQEHIIKIATDIAGYKPNEADKLRKSIGKSLGEDVIEKEREKFVVGCIENIEGFDRETADRLFDQIVKFGRYGFNRSHAVCYSLIAYWTMYLKKHYPIEFYWASMKNEPDIKKIQRFAKDAGKHGVETLLPDVSISGSDFAIDYKNKAIRGSLSDIKGIGNAAVKRIVESERPFTSLIDFLQKTVGREVNKRTMVSLVDSGALDSLIPNPRWLSLSLEDFWKYVKKQRWEQIELFIERSTKALQWTEHERLRFASDVNPLAITPSPAIIWEDFLKKHVKFPIDDITIDLIANKEYVYVIGKVTDIEERNVGDASSETPGESERKKIGWGNRWLKLTIEGEDTRVTGKIRWNIMDEFEDIVKDKEDKVFLIAASVNHEYQTLYIDYLVDIEELSSKVESKKGLNTWEKLFVDHPANSYPWKNKSDKRIAFRSLDKINKGKKVITAIGVISQLYEFEDRNGELMARFTLTGPSSKKTLICFSSSWLDFKEHLKLGRFVSVKLSRLPDGSAHLKSIDGALTILNR